MVAAAAGGGLRGLSPAQYMQAGSADLASISQSISRLMDDVGISKDDARAVRAVLRKESMAGPEGKELVRLYWVQLCEAVQREDLDEVGLGGRAGAQDGGRGMQHVQLSAEWRVVCVQPVFRYARAVLVLPAT